VSTTAMGAPLTFYDSGSCPYAHRTWLALEEKKLPYNTKKVDLQNKSQEFQDVYHTVNPDPESRAKVPILIDDGSTVIESLLTVEYLDAKYPNSGTRLYPTDPAQSFKVKLFTETFSERVNAFSLLRASTPEELDAATKSLINGLKIVNKFLEVHGSEEGGDYFLGGTYSAAETVTTPFVRRLLVALPPLRDIDVNAIIKAEGLHRLGRWIQASLDRDSNKKTGPTDEAIVEGFKRFLQPIAVK